MIGVFDSGLGGLTAVKELRRILPHESVIYFGDTGRVPYGTRSRETIINYARQDVRFLLTKNVSTILIACGTVSANALDVLRREFDIPMIGVVEPTCRRAAELTKNGKVAVIGTAATVKTGAYEAELHRIDPSLEVVSAACPLFVPLVENGFTEGEIPRLTAEHYLADIRRSGADTLILGCTHYPMLAGVISEVLPGISLVSSGAEAAKHLASAVTPTGEGEGKTEYYVSDSTTDFLATAEKFLQTPVRGRVAQININEY